MTDVRQGPSEWDAQFDKLPTKEVETLIRIAFGGKGWTARNDPDGRKIIFVDPKTKKISIYKSHSWSEVVRQAATAIGLTHAQFSARMNAALGRRASEKELRSKVIRLAHANAALRPDLLPLLERDS